MIAVLGISALTAIVFSPPVSTTRLDAAAHQIQSDIEYARQLATTTGVMHGVVAAPDGTYTVYSGTTTNLAENPLTKQPWVVLIADRYPGVSLRGTYRVEFNRFGAPTTGGGSGFEVTDGTSVRTIIIEMGTGTVRII